MEKNEIFNRLQDVIRDTVDNDELVLTNTSTAQDVDGWDSLAQVIIVGEIRNVFGVKLSSKEVATLTNVGELVNIIDKKINS